jgi:hypothetical protein
MSVFTALEDGGATCFPKWFIGHEAVVEHTRNDDEDGEGEQLHEQAGSDQFFARV